MMEKRYYASEITNLEKKLKKCRKEKKELKKENKRLIDEGVYGEN